MRRIYPDPDEWDDPLTIYDELWRDLPAPPDNRAAVLLNMVTSVDGKATLKGKARGIGSEIDHRLMRSIRAAADAVLSGASTLRAERIDLRAGPDWQAVRRERGLSPEPLGILLSTQGDFPLEHPFFGHRDQSRIVVIGAETPADRQRAIAERADLLVAPTTTPAPRWLLERLRVDHGVNHLLVEGGPGVNGSFFAAGMVDEICWTLAPKIIGGGETLTMVTGPALPAPFALTLHSAFLHESEFFLRYRVTGAAE